MYRGIELWPKEMTKDMITKQFLGKEAIQTYPNLPKNIYESFVRTAKRLPDKEAVVDHLGKTYTYRVHYGFGTDRKFIEEVMWHF